MRILSGSLVFAGILSLASVGEAESLTPQETELLGLINGSRAQAGLRPLRVDAMLSAVARAHSLDMATSRFFSHSSPTTGDMGDRLAAAQVRFQAAGENIALNVSVPSAHQALMQSQHHRENLLSPEFTFVGLGIVSNGQQIVVTENFIRPGRGFQAVAPSQGPEPFVAEPFVAEPSEQDLVQVQPPFGFQGGCGGGEDAQDFVDDPSGYEVDACPQGSCGLGQGAVSVVPSYPQGQMLAPQGQPQVQVQVMPGFPMVQQVQPGFPMVQPVQPQQVAPQGIWVLGPNGAWHPVVARRFAVRPSQRRVVFRSHRNTF